MSLIDRKQVMECLTKEYNRRFMQGDRDGLKLAWIEKAVNDAPEVDAVPVEFVKESIEILKFNGMLSGALLFETLLNDWKANTERKEE